MTSSAVAEITRRNNSPQLSPSGFIQGLLLLAVLSSGLGCAVNSRSSDGAIATLPRQLFLVRHAEREWEGEDPPLVAAGEARAQALAETLRDAGISRIITTQWRRTRATAEPLAKLLRITPEVIPVFDGKARENVAAVAAAVRRYKDETVLIVGHITVTGVLAALGARTCRRFATTCSPICSCSRRLPERRV